MIAPKPVLAGFGRVAPFVEIDQPAAEHGHDERRHQIGNRQRRGHRHRERLRERPRDAAQEAERQEDDQGREAGSGQGLHEFAACRKNRLIAGDMAVPVIGAGAARDVFDHHDHIVDEEPHRGRDAAQRHDVEAHPGGAQHHDGGHERCRHDEDRDQGNAPALEEQDEDQPGEHKTDQNGVANACRRLKDELALVIPIGETHAGRKRETGKLLLNGLGDLHRIPVGLLIDAEEDRRLAIFDRSRPLRHDAGLHRGNIAHTDDAGRIGSHDQGADIGRLGCSVAREHEKELAAILQPADRLQDIAAGQYGGELIETDAIGGEPVRIGKDLDFRSVAPLDRHSGEAWYRGEHRPDLVLGEIVERCARHGVRLERVGDDGIDRRVHSPHVVDGARGKARQSLGDRRIDEQRARDHVGPPREVDGKLRGAARRVGADVLNAGDRTNGFFKRRRHEQRGLIRRPAAGVDIDDDAGKGDLRKKAHGERRRRDRAGNGERRRQYDDGARLIFDEPDERHSVLLVRTREPS